MDFRAQGFAELVGREIVIAAIVGGVAVAGAIALAFWAFS